ncbi:MAG TPA: TrbI F-type domain-containing protein [Candidatus Thiothrix moscowensis]|uniref:TrbI F-type domain-containing protein n=1 Tax=unclassified Thiothrix TaxID=2636184 RepID=UPI0025CDE204|nr:MULTISPECIES: TrbI F-type domain-containing protein [unclassified Thiothrix]HRJ52238.1 TrbI F-type domain-containing protein [Candidatus Thiothrix moscowensis]HRJ92553.1 TrbI F-type domain-containing protein [Candidatus Thiothrix moscowensis]
MQRLAKFSESIRPWVTLIGAGFTGALVALLLVRIWFPPPVFIRLDLAALVAEQVQVLASRQDDGGATRTQLAAAFAQQLDVQSRAMAEEYHAVVLVAPAVVAGVPDLTGELRQRMVAAMGSPGVQSDAPAVALPVQPPLAQQPVFSTGGQP